MGFEDSLKKKKTKEPSKKKEPGSTTTTRRRRKRGTDRDRGTRPESRTEENKNEKHGDWKETAKTEPFEPIVPEIQIIILALERLLPDLDRNLMETKAEAGKVVPIVRKTDITR